MYEKLYREFLLRYNELKAENKQLEVENMRLHRQLGLPKETDKNVENSSIHLSLPRPHVSLEAVCLWM